MRRQGSEIAVRGPRTGSPHRRAGSAGEQIRGVVSKTPRPGLRLLRARANRCNRRASRPASRSEPHARAASPASSRAPQRPRRVSETGYQDDGGSCPSRCTAHREARRRMSYRTANVSASATAVSAASPSRSKLSFKPRETSRRLVDGRDVGASGRELRRLSSGRGTKIEHCQTCNVAEQLDGQSRGRVLHPPVALA